MRSEVAPQKLAFGNYADEVARVHSSQSSFTCMLLHYANAACTIRRASQSKTNNNRIYHMAWFNFSRKAYHLEEVECRHADGTLRSDSRRCCRMDVKKKFLKSVSLLQTRDINTGHCLIRRVWEYYSPTRVGRGCEKWYMWRLQGSKLSVVSEVRLLLPCLSRRVIIDIIKITILPSLSHDQNGWTVWSFRLRLCGKHCRSPLVLMHPRHQAI